MSNLIGKLAVGTIDTLLVPDNLIRLIRKPRC